MRMWLESFEYAPKNEKVFLRAKEALESGACDMALEVMEARARRKRKRRVRKTG
jgi:hypothetical protein